MMASIHKCLRGGGQLFIRKRNSRFSDQKDKRIFPGDDYCMGIGFVD